MAVSKTNACTFCSYTTDDKSYFTTHLRIHTGERPFKCGDCNYKATCSAKKALEIQQAVSLVPPGVPFDAFSSPSPVVQGGVYRTGAIRTLYSQ